MKTVAEGKDTFLGAALLFIAARTAKGRVETVFVERMQKRLCLHQVGVHLAAVSEWADSGTEGLHVAFYDELPAVGCGVFVAELQHFLELPLRVDVHQREWRLAWGKGFLSQPDHDGRILADAVKHDRVFKLRSHLADDIDGFCL